MKYYADDKRHLVCIPYSRSNLLAMAEDLNIGPWWFHRAKYEHIDIPKRMLLHVLADTRVQVVSPRTVLVIAKTGLSPESGECERAS